MASYDVAGDICRALDSGGDQMEFYELAKAYAVLRDSEKRVGPGRYWVDRCVNIG